MREIKFRGKRIDNGEWAYGDLIRHYENQRRFIACDQLAFTYTECGIDRLVSECYHEVYTSTVGQFTGLLDKNGKEIYESDILGGIFGLPIIYCDGCKSFQGFNWDEETGEVFDCMACEGDMHWWEVVGENGQIEVIGNIHEWMCHK